MLKISAAGLLLSFLSVLHASASQSEQKASLNNARRLYSQKCATCHGSDGSANTAAGTKMKMVDLRSKQVQDMNDQELYNVTAEGLDHKSYPHAFLHRGVTEQQIRDLIKLIRTFKK